MVCIAIGKKVMARPFCAAVSVGGFGGVGVLPFLHSKHESLTIFDCYSGVSRGQRKALQPAPKPFPLRSLFNLKFAK